MPSYSDPRNQKPIEIYSRSEKKWISWIRKGAGDYKASQNELRLMKYDSVAQADRFALDEFGLDAICTEAVRRYRNIFAAQKPNSPWIDDSDNDFLYHIGALAKGHDDQLHPTTAGLLAFGYEYEITNYLPPNICSITGKKPRGSPDGMTVSLPEAATGAEMSSISI